MYFMQIVKRDQRVHIWVLDFHVFIKCSHFVCLIFHQFSYSKGMHVGHRSILSWVWLSSRMKQGTMVSCWGTFFPGFLHVISDVHIQLSGDISPFWWVLGSLRFQVSSIFLCQHKDCLFSQLGKYCLRCGSGDLHFCSLLCRPCRWQARDFWIVPDLN